MKSLKDRITLILLLGVYAMVGLRYVPNNLGRTVTETLLNLANVAPLTIGGTILIVSFMQRTLSGKLPWDRIARIFLTLAIMTEFFFGLHDYLNKKQVVVTDGNTQQVEKVEKKDPLSD